MQTYKIKMTDLQVVQRTLDFWDPLGTSLYSGGSIGQIDEYDRYAPKILEMLSHESTEVDLRQYLDEVRFEKIGLSRKEIPVAKNRFYAWALLQTWTVQKRPDSNLRVKDRAVSEVISGTKKNLSELELIQQFLQDWDPKGLVKEWLCGADTIATYDEAAVHVLKLLRDNASTEDLAIALNWISTSKNDATAFFLENWSKGKGQLQDALREKIEATAHEKLWVAKNLQLVFKYIGSRPKREFC